MWVILLCVGMVCAQNPLGAINDIFTQPSIPGYEDVTEKAQEDLGALEKCGEGSGRGIRKCVPYYMCDGKTNTIVQSGKTDGFGIIDIRFGANSCQHPLDVCCNEPETTSKDEVPDIPDIPNPSVSTETPDLPSPPTPKPTKIPDLPSPNPPVHHKALCGIRNPNGIDFKITGNMLGEAEYGEFPWMISVLKKNYVPSADSVLAVCGGSLIAPNVVLTGAHCVYKFKTHEIKIRAGEWDTQTEKERLPYQERDVIDIIIHEDFAPQTLFNDVALLILSDPFTQANNIATVCLPQQEQRIDSKHCFASGWGKNSFGREGEYQVILKKIELPIVRHDRCQEALRITRLGRHFNLHSSFTCAGGEEGKDTCTGDGGSPLVCPDPNNPDRYIQAGIVAWGIGCGEDGVPGVYGDVSKFREWIDENMQRLNFDTSSYYI